MAEIISPPPPRQAEKVTHWWQANFRFLICLSLVIPVSH